MTEVAPGWYPISAETLRWWDGEAWGTYTIPALPTHQASTSPDVTLATLSHASFFALPLIAPLIIRVSRGKSDEFARHHSTEALNFHIMVQLIVLIGFIGFVVTEIASWDADTSSGWFFLWILGMIALQVCGSVFAIFACVKTGKGEWYRYPITIRFVPGAVSGERAAVK